MQALKCAEQLPGVPHIESRSVVAHVPGTRATWIAIGPQGSDISTDDGRTWAPVAGPGFDTFSFVKGKPMGWAAGARGAIGRLLHK